MIVTAPTSSTAAVYQKELNSLKVALPSLRSCVDVRCVSDPSGRRVGSGGGTLNAIDIAYKTYGVDFMKSSRTLIIHSGGDSRRAPFHSICGKAWTSLNSHIDDALATPLAILIEELSLLASSIPTGSTTVASCDVLLDLKLNSQHAMQIEIPKDGVTIIAVPELPSIAKNHGVLVLPGHDSKLTDRFSLNVAEYYLQKPSIETMNEVGAMSAQGNFAFIDTGVVILAGTALDAMYGLLQDSTIQKCTNSWQGASFRELRLELYSDILLALKLGSNKSSTKSLGDFFESLGIERRAAEERGETFSDYHYSLSLLHDRLCETPLYMLTVSDGLFCHLGTSKELLELITCPNVAVSSSPPSSSLAFPRLSCDNHDKFVALAMKYKLTKEVGSLLIVDEVEQYQPTPNTHTEGYKINSIISISDECRISSNALVEHSLLSGNFEVGAGSVVSHVRADIGENLILLPGMMIQQVPIKSKLSIHGMNHKTGLSESTSFVFILLGVEDDVKASYLSPNAHICGVSWNEFLSKTALTIDDVWPFSTSDQERTLWNASIFPCIDACSSSPEFQGECIVSSGENIDVKYTPAWMQFLFCKELPKLISFEHLNTSIEIWKRCRKYSLSELMKIGDASRMHGWRRHMKLAVEHLKPSSKEQKLFYSDFIYGKGQSLTSSVGKVFDISTNCMLKLEIKLIEIFGITHEQIKMRHLLWSLLQILTIFYLCSPNLFEIYEQSFDVDQNVPEIVKEVVYCVLSLSGSDLKDERIERQVFVVLLDAMKSMKGDDKSFVHARDSLHGLNLFMNSLIDHGGIESIGISISILPKYFAAIRAEFQPRFLLLYSWLLMHGEYKLPSHFRIDDINLRNIAPCPSISVTDLDVKQVGIKMISERLELVSQEFQKVMEALNHLPLSRSHNASKVDNETKISKIIESWSQSLICTHVQYSLHREHVDNVTTVSVESIQKAIQKQGNAMVISKSPVRVDFAGGWSDTPPCSYETMGAVLNAAILVDGRYPIRSIARYTDEPRLSLKSVRELYDRSTNRSEYEIFESCEIRELCDFEDASNPLAPCGLLKAVLIALGVQDTITSFLSTYNSNSSASVPKICSLFGGKGLEVVGISGLPAGSGMGGSSILAAAVLKATSELLGIFLSPRTLVFLTSQVEQIMTTGGGWQDQLGAIYGGVKIGRSECGLPINISCEQVTISEDFAEAFEKRACLIYTGKQRLAKDTLINALRKTSMTPVDMSCHLDDDVISTVKRLTNSAEVAYENIRQYSNSLSKLISEEAIDDLSKTLNEYWSLKKQMAAGSEPSHIRELFAYLSPLCSGWSLCGAGAGGFAIIIAKRGTNLEDIRGKLEDYMVNEENLSMHEVKIDSTGIHSKTYAGESALKFTSGDVFSLLDIL